MFKLNDPVLNPVLYRGARYNASHQCYDFKCEHVVFYDECC